jgi:glyoxylase-like metal-dependent hydrolase (beta-lactamase superfamily II)
MGRGIPMVDFTAKVPVPRELDVRWIHGSPSAKHNTDPDIQVHEYDEHTFILRQNMAINYEAPFMFLLFGNAQAALIDTGATGSAELFPLRRVIDERVECWLALHPPESSQDGYRLLVLHTHPHGDHVAGDAQFTDRPDTLVVDAGLSSIREYFAFGDNHDLVAHVDLGGRVLDCLATPGHHEAAITFYDPYTGLLLTGDTVYPGRLYVENWSAFRGTIDRLITFASARTITHILGSHIEMTSQPGIDYPVRTTFQPDEPQLQMTLAQLRDLRLAIDEIGDRPARQAFPDFVIYPEEEGTESRGPSRSTT